MLEENVHELMFLGVLVREMILSATPHSSQQRKLVTSKGSSLIGYKQAAQQVEEAMTKAEAAQKRLRVEESEVQLERFTQMGNP
jgi:hypothetical protein